MPQLPRDVIKDRARRLREAGDTALRRHLDAQVGLLKSVLVETDSLARTEGFTPVKLAMPCAPGLIVELPIGGHDGRMLLAA